MSMMTMNSFEIKNSMLGTDAPSTFRTPISLNRRTDEKAESPIKPKQAIMSFLWNMDGSNGIDSTCPKKSNSYLITRTKEAQKASK